MVRTITQDNNREAFNWKKLIVPGAVMLAFWTLGAALVAIGRGNHAAVFLRIYRHLGRIGFGSLRRFAQEEETMGTPAGSRPWWVPS